MTRRREWIIGLSTIALIGVGGLAYRVHSIVTRIPEMYAADEAGKVLIAYMKHNADRWPSSWQDIRQTWQRVAASNEDPDKAYPLVADRMEPSMRQLERNVEIDWAFDPKHPDARTPFTTKTGGPFNIVLVGGEPNEMVRRYLRESKQRIKPVPASTNPF